MNQLVILAGGRGSRMKSDTPKSLQKIGNTTIIEKLLDSVENLFPEPVVVVGHLGDKIVQAVGDRCHYVWQHDQLGTAHALSCAREELKDFQHIIVLPGDHPLIKPDTLEEMLIDHRLNEHMVTVATITVPNFEGDFKLFEHYGRIIRDSNGEISGIVEYKDATEEQRNIKELNTSYYCFSTDWLWKNLSMIGDNNVSKEYYLTDIVRIAVSQKQKISSIPVRNYTEAVGVNSPEELSIATAYVI